MGLLQRRDVALPEPFFDRLPPACQQMLVSLHLKLSWDGLSVLESALAGGEGSTLRARFVARGRRDYGATGR